MSRIGKLPITLPADVSIDVSKSNLVTIKGPKGALSQQVDPDLKLNVDGSVVTISRPN